MTAYAYFNEIDPFAAAWLRELIKAGHIAQGEVDERSIEDVRPSDLAGFTQCHFFAGIGVWSYSLRCAGWPDSRPVWTGSCPCQPFSAAGKRGGTSDERHLWPSFFHLISNLRPPTLFGEQVASKDGLAWFDLVSSDLEGEKYSILQADLCAAGFGAPHIRQRLYFVANTNVSGEYKRTSGRQQRASELGNSDYTGPQGRLLGRDSTDQLPSGTPGLVNELADTELNERRQERPDSSRSGEGSRAQGLEQRSMHSGLVNGVWANADWIYCRDEKYRPVEAGTFPLAHGIANRVGKLRGYGNAIVAPVAQAFIESYLEVERD